MIWWKEWRETRFVFLTTLFFVTGTYYGMPSTGQLDDNTYWRGIFLAFFVTAIAIVFGSSAISSEIGANTMTFLISKPARRAKVLTAKYFIRVAEVLLVYLAPVLCMITWKNLQMWMWVPPYLFQKYILMGALMVLFLYSATLLLSIILTKQSLSVLAGIGLLVTYLALRGMVVLRKIADLEAIDTDILLLAMLCLLALGASLILFKREEF